MQPSIFSKIINGEIPCHKIYEDERTFAFLDIYPIQPGQILVVTKEQVENFYELSEGDYAAFTNTVKKVAAKLSTEFPDKKRIGVMIEGLEVPHVHAKVFPIDTGTDYRREPDMNIEPDHTALAEMAKKLAITEGNT